MAGVDVGQPAGGAAAILLVAVGEIAMVGVSSTVVVITGVAVGSIVGSAIATAVPVGATHGVGGITVPGFWLAVSGPPITIEQPTFKMSSVSEIETVTIRRKC